MDQLYRRLALHIQHWRTADYACEQFPVIAEILQHQFDPITDQLACLRRAQFRALETYWYLRLIERTPHVLDLYQRLFPVPIELLAALGVTHASAHAYAHEHGLEALWLLIRNDATFVYESDLEALRETLTLDYASYILALAMGAGKTLLIGAIIASEFAMAFEYPDGPFVQNALVFAPGKTILESLRELSSVPYERILPPRFYRPFAASAKITFTRDGEADVPIIHGSRFNVVVTNTEKIRIHKEATRRSVGDRQRAERGASVRAEIANLRLQTVASLPALAVFSDEAHHTYGRALGRELKKVRRTVDYLHQHSPNLVCVVNTTGTPYLNRRPLPDVVVWYGISEGIADGILKEVAGSIVSYDFAADQTDTFVAAVVADFMRDYGDVRLPDGAPARLAIYFAQTTDLTGLRPVIESALAATGLPPSLVLTNTSRSTPDEVEAFNRLNDPRSPQRIILLVNKGTEGWNCPSLFACALARRLPTAHTFVLQAATRCLRQVAGNSTRARIYLARDNVALLDRQLQETYGETLADLDHILRKPLPLARTEPHTRIVPQQKDQNAQCIVRTYPQRPGPIALHRPDHPHSERLLRAVHTITEQHGGSMLRQIGDTATVEAEADTLDLYTATVRLAATYRLDLWQIRSELLRLYGEAGALPTAHLYDLMRQIEEQMSSRLTVDERR